MPSTVLIATTNNVANSSGFGSQVQLVYAVNGALWWAFWIDSTNTAVIKCSSSPDFVTWTARTSLTTLTANDGSMQDIGVAYANIGGVDVVHLHRFNSGNGTGYHTRATMSGTTITWGVEKTFAFVDSSPDGASVGIATDGTVWDALSNGTAVWSHQASPVDSGGAWTFTTWAEVQVVSRAAASSSQAIIPLASANMLLLADDGALLNTFENIQWSLWTGSWSAATNVRGVSLTGGNAQSPGNWSWAKVSNTDVHLLFPTSTSDPITFEHYRFNGTTMVSGDAIDSLTIGAGIQGLALLTNGTSVWAFVIKGTDIFYNAWSSGVGWGGWIALGLASATRANLGSSHGFGSTIGGLVWTEGVSSPFTLSGLAFTPTVPGAPTGLSCTPQNGSVTVSWVAGTAGAFSPTTSYTVTASPGGLTATTANGSATSASISGLTNGTRYTFTVHATNGVGNSAESAASGGATPYALIDGQGLGAGFSGMLWSGNEIGSPTGFIWGRYGTTENRRDGWQKLGQWSPGAAGFHSPNPPFPLLSASPTGSGGITLGSRLAGSSAAQQVATGAVVLGSRLAAGAVQEQAATGAVVLGNRLAAGIAVETFTAAGAVTLGNLVVSGAAREQAATGAVVLGNRLAAATAVETFTAAGAIVLGDLVVSGAAREQAATGAVTLGNRLAAATAVETFTAAGAVVLGNLVVSGAAREQVATGAVVLGDRVVAGSVLETFIAAGALILGDRLVAGAAREQAATGSVVLGNRLAAAAAIETFTAVAALVLGSRLVSGAEQEQAATGAVTLGNRLVAGAALETFLATGALVLGNRTISGAVLQQLASGALTLGDRQVAAAAVETFLAAGALVLGDRSVAGALLQQVVAGALVLGDRLVAGAAAAAGGNVGSIVLGNRLVNVAAIRRLLVSAQLGLGVEQLRRLTQSMVAPVGSMGAVQRLLPVGLEAAHRLAPSTVLPLEWRQRVVGTQLTRVESAQTLQRAVSILTGAGAAFSRQALFDLEASGFSCFQTSIDNATFIAQFGMTAQELLLQLLNGTLVTITPEHLLSLRKSGSGTPLPIPQRG